MLSLFKLLRSLKTRSRAGYYSLLMSVATQKSSRLKSLKLIREAYIFIFFAFLVSYTTTTFAEQNRAAKDLMAINHAMRPIYEAERLQFQQKLLRSVPVIVARFSSDGGRLTLYRPGKAPLMAKRVPEIYRFAKSVAHAVMISEVFTNSHLNENAADWHQALQAFQDKISVSLNTLNQLDISSQDKQLFQSTLQIVHDYLSLCLSSHSLNETMLHAYIEKVKPYIPQLIKVAAHTQIKHQMAILSEWKTLLGQDWGKTYAMTNTIYVTRQNNLMFSMLAEFMGKEAINRRLFLFETTSFTTTDDVLLDLWARILFDRQLSNMLFDNEYLMDSELLANGGKAMISREAEKYGLPDILPKNAPFDSTEWPWRHEKA